MHVRKTGICSNKLLKCQSCRGGRIPLGHPRKPYNERNCNYEKTEQRSFMLRVRLTEQEAERYKLKAEKEGITLSELVRESLESHQTIVISGYDDEMKSYFRTIKNRQLPEEIG